MSDNMEGADEEQMKEIINERCDCVEIKPNVTTKMWLKIVKPSQDSTVIEPVTSIWMILNIK